jgi:hypothetical protein
VAGLPGEVHCLGVAWGYGLVACCNRWSCWGPLGDAVVGVALLPSCKMLGLVGGQRGEDAWQGWLLAGLFDLFTAIGEAKLPGCCPKETEEGFTPGVSR